ncbi:uncharacterized protein LOC110985157 [Acanthaster planci]|uniref:Uncharacterized protein LOC110985157 n=1 Tax=Acanthaster planci TaxID=133434 RepID=A0A8B7ZEN0_ACAPL|nr:uncharacterized protein LOC110985157 [Acanthaster planci]
MNPGKRSFYSGIGTSLVEKILSGLSDFGTRSLNLSVMVNDPELKEAYTAAQTNGQLPSNRARVLILGEPRAGKTSLLNRLLGKEFDRLEQPTHGIETRMCHVINVDKKWNQSDAAKADDIQECASALFLAIAVVYTLKMFHYGYFQFVLCAIIAMATILDYNNAYRFATSMSFVAVLFEALIRIDKPLEDLASYDLMCPVNRRANPGCSERSFLVPAVLPPYQGEPEKFWEPVSGEEVFYFDFGFFDPSTIYYRLLARCLTLACHSDRVNANDSSPLIFADRCRFHVGTSFIFKVQLERRSSQQMLLSVTVLAFEPEKPSTKLLRCLLETVRSIITRDYPHLHFIFGPRCPFCGRAAKSCSSKMDGEGNTHGSRDINTLDHDFHVLKMAGNDQAFPTRSPVIMICGQKRYEMPLSGLENKTFGIEKSYPPCRVAFDLNTPITKLPPDLFQKVCQLLNNSSGNRSWKTLAGELGKDVESVAALDSDRVANPTEQLLREWAMLDGKVTVRDLLKVLARPSLRRMDIIHTLRAQMSPAESPKP